MAAFTAVVMGVLVSMSGIMPEPTDSGAQKRAGIGEVGIVDQGDEYGGSGFWPDVIYDDEHERVGSSHSKSSSNHKSSYGHKIELEHDDTAGAAFRW